MKAVRRSADQFGLEDGTDKKKIDREIVMEELEWMKSF